MPPPRQAGFSAVRGWCITAVVRGSRRTGRADSGGWGSQRRRLGFAAAAGVRDTSAGWLTGSRLAVGGGMAGGVRGVRVAACDWRLSGFARIARGRAGVCGEGGLAGAVYTAVLIVSTDNLD